MRGRRALAMGIVLAGTLLALRPGAFALDPLLDINQYAHTAWKIREGFVKGEITSIAQTPDGYLWLGTAFGLLRFDGVRNVPLDPLSNGHLPSSYVYSLLVASDGTLWIGTGKGLASWKHGKLTQYTELAEDYVFALHEDRDGAIWAGGVGIGVPTGKLCTIHNSRVQCYGEDGALGRGVAALYEDSKGNLWVGVETGLWRWKPGTPKFYPLPGEPNGIQALSEDADGTLLVGWHGGIHRFVDGKTEAWLLPGVTRQFRARRILRDRDGSLWIGSFDHGLLHIHKGRIDVFQQSAGLSDDTINTLFEDRERNVWIATAGGLDRFRDFAAPTFSVNQGLSNALLSSVLPDRDGGVWLGTYGGLNQWKNGRITVFRTDGVRRSGKLNGLPPNSLFQDDRGRIWVATIDGTGYLENNRFTPVSGVPGGSGAGALWRAGCAAGENNFAAAGIDKTCGGFAGMFK